jgi:hypothetical protein
MQRSRPGSDEAECPNREEDAGSEAGKTATEGDSLIDKHWHLIT